MGNLFSINSPLWEFFTKVAHFLWLSILWFVCCLPIVTIGASTTALYTVTLKYARNEEGYLAESFLRAFKENLKQAVIIWSFLLFLGMFLGIILTVYTRSTSTGMIATIFTTVFFGIFLVYILTNIYVYAVLAKFSNSTARTMMNAAVMAICHWPSSILMLAGCVLVIVIGFFYFPPILFFAPAGIAYFNSRLLVKVFDRYI